MLIHSGIRLRIGPSVIKARGGGLASNNMMVGPILFHVSTVQFIPRCEPNNRTYDWPQAQLQSSSRITSLTHVCHIRVMSTHAAGRAATVKVLL